MMAMMLYLVLRIIFHRYVRIVREYEYEALQ